jgi:hypothetical protein
MFKQITRVDVVTATMTLAGSGSSSWLLSLSSSLALLQLLLVVVGGAQTKAIIIVKVDGRNIDFIPPST